MGGKGSKSKPEVDMALAADLLVAACADDSADELVGYLETVNATPFVKATAVVELAGRGSDNFGSGSALAFAVAAGAADVVAALIDAGAPPTAYLPSGTPLIFVAWEAGAYSLAHAMLEAATKGDGKSLKYLKDGEQRSLLHRMVASDAVLDGVTAPPLASWLALMVAGGAVLSDKDKDGASAVFAAVASQWRYADELLAFVASHREACSTIVEGGDVANASGDSRGTSLLHAAVSSGSLSLVQAVLQLKPALDAARCDGVTPLAMAVSSGAADMVNLLLAAVAERPEADLALGMRTAAGESLLTLCGDNAALRATVAGAMTAAQLARVEADDAMHRAAGCTPDTALRIQLISDVHTEFFDEWRELLIPAAPVLALLGDIGLVYQDKYREFVLEQTTRFEHVILLAGNHEYYADKTGACPKQSVSQILASMTALAGEADNLHFLDNAVLDLGVFRIAGTTLWGCVPDADIDAVQMRMNDYRRIWISDEARLTVRETNEWHATAVAFVAAEAAAAAAADQTLVVLSHHAPTIAAGYSNIDFYGSNLTGAMGSDQSELLQHDALSLWAYGHLHWFYDRVDSSGTRIVSHPKGYPHDKLEWARDGLVVTVEHRIGVSA
ncbi:Ser/Thr protein phosphatase [Thecamonas trahens ATCC 50062]|uniref:Ser/Thr protein phosphatase n=1 Tax=Thecamonas trahens ATCC 50062 TaxID=461836 RepID=A0A0L0DXU7_THETB|nr:Ser/Thr protein phosphatase [Thecamonas trahens ATCC 50062]KNC56353.1 Ser/Thr protein phosphatase [Thecamonas trahens ATCC 50062]|eukprot:XP_013760870.1 Ser/Thr protein phosphatase [Thecamonas trahens ATCC 50062]